MKIPGVGTIRYYAKKVGRGFSPHIRALLYHRVSELPLDPQWLSVRPENFERQMRFVRERFSPISVPEMLAGLAAGEIPKDAVVVTFDDGYADNLQNAKPILEKYEIPAAIFVSTGYLGGTREFWWDEVERRVFEPDTLPEKLSLAVGGKNYEWRLADARKRKSPRDWTIFDRNTPTERHRLYRDLANILKELVPEIRDGVVDAIAQWSGGDREARRSHRQLTEKELATLGRNSLIEIGAHTVRHPKLSVQAARDQAAEIQGSRFALEKILGRKINAFAYPYGGQLDYTDETIAALKSAGMECAFSAMHNCIRHDSDCFQLPRFFVRDWNRAQFARKLASFSYY